MSCPNVFHKKFRLKVWASCKARRLLFTYFPAPFRAAAGGIVIIALTYICGTTDYNGAGMDVIQRAVEQGLFEIKETTVVHSDGHTSINKTPKVTGKGQIYFVNQFVKR